MRSSGRARALALPLYTLFLLLLVGGVLAASVASAADAPSEQAPLEGPRLQQGASLVAPPAEPQSSGGTAAADAKKGKAGADSEAAPESEGSPGSSPALPATEPSEVFEIPSIPTSTCASTGVPPVLIPIYQRAAATYNLGPQGPAVLAGINEVETAFGTNLNVSSAGAIGWMQFMPGTWESYGVDANGDGVPDPYNPEDAIFAAASYLSASGMPTDTYGAIYSYNHADWYVAEVLANAACYGSMAGGVAGTLSLEPQLQKLTCKPAPAWRKHIPPTYLVAFEEAAARYELGRRGVWALAAVARLESNFGRGMSKRQLRRSGPLGLDRTEWGRYAVDGDGDGHIRRADPADSAATLARLIWSRGSLRAGVFTHNQAAWYVDAVMAEAEKLAGSCEATAVDWSIALPAAASTYINPFAFSTNLVTGRIDQGVDFTGTGPIVAIGDAVILRTGAPGWPEEGGVLYQLLDGPLKGQVIFVYEGVDATVQPGQRVQAGEQVATFRPGGSIETGLADDFGVPLSHDEYYEGKVTVSGLQMFSLLQALGI